MKRISMIIVATLTLALLVYAHSRTSKSKGETPTSPPQTDSSTDKTVATQDRLNRYFKSKVLAKLKTCWKDVRGDGTIEMKFTYTKAGDNWTWEKLGVNRSTLPRGQDAVASKCMQDAVRATSFAVEEGERAANIKDGAGAPNKFVVNWSWPVPLPANSAEFAAFRNKAGGGNTGGCDGHGALALCWTCKNSSCLNVCVGYDTCEESPGGCHANAACASGGPFKKFGGVLMY